MAKDNKAEVALTTEERLAAITAGYNPDFDFRALALEATYVHMGYTLVDKSQLKGVPLVVIGVTYREGIPQGDRLAGDYVSVECVCGGPADIARNIRLGLLDENSLRIDPNMPVVFNDGSTGIRRQLTQLFHSKGMINVGPSPDKDEKLNNQFDRPWQYWIQEYPDNALVTGKSVGFTAEPDGAPMRLVFFNGLRSSEYEWAPGAMAETWYFG